MNKRILLLGKGLVLAVYSTIAASIPASTEYVNNKIKESIDGVLAEVAKHQQQMESKINVLPTLAVHQVGELYQGGIIFWVDESKQHGLIVSKLDANPGAGIEWQNGESGDKVTNARANGLYAGLANTNLIVGQQTVDDQEGIFAALSAQNFSVQSDGVSPCVDGEWCYGNWYLPSLNELQLLRASLYGQGLVNCSDGFYWTSTESSVNQAYVVNWATGESMRIDKYSAQPKVRAIHVF